MAENQRLWEALHRMGFKIVVNPYVPPDTIVVHATTAKCLKAWAENQRAEKEVPRPPKPADPA